MNELPTDDSVANAMSRTATVTDGELARMDLDQGFEHLLARIYAEPATVKHPSWRRRVYVSLAMLGALATASAFATPLPHGIGHALTGMFRSGPHEGGEDYSEVIDLSAPDFPAVARSIAAEMRHEGMRYAPGYDPVANINHVITTWSGGPERVLTRETGVRGFFAEEAMCTWDHSWVDAYAVGNQAGMRTATDGMRQLGKMKIYAQINDATWQAGLLKAAETGNAGPVQNQASNCGPEVK